MESERMQRQKGAGPRRGKNLRYILFDLDETLYPRQAGVMQQIDRLMNQYLTERMGLAVDEARHMRRDYWQRYGTTLAGLRANHGIDAEEFLAYVHDFPLDRYLMPNGRLDEALARIPLEKVVFTNASREHARRVLDVLGIAHHFTRIYDVVAMAYLSKPNPAAYRRLLALLNAEGEECIMVEDSARNLASAKSFGIVTILVDGEPDAAVDYVVREVEEVADVVQRLLPG